MPHLQGSHYAAESLRKWGSGNTTRTTASMMRLRSAPLQAVVPPALSQLSRPCACHGCYPLTLRSSLTALTLLSRGRWLHRRWRKTPPGTPSLIQYIRSAYASTEPTCALNGWWRTFCAPHQSRYAAYNSWRTQSTGSRNRNLCLLSRIPPRKHLLSQ